MEYNSEEIVTLGSVFSLTSSNTSTVSYDINETNVFNKFWVIDIEETSEIPVFAKYLVPEEIRRGVTKILMPIHVSITPLNVRTFRSVIINAFGINLVKQIKKVITSKNEVYYVGKGIILDKNFNILLVCTQKMVNGSEGRFYPHPTSTVYVHPKVFESSNLMTKGILFKMLPYYLGREYKVVIKNLTEKFIKSTDKFHLHNSSNDALNQILIDNIDEVLDQM